MVRIPIYTRDGDYVNTRLDAPSQWTRRAWAATGLPQFFICPQGKVWDVQSICMRLQTDANVANRQITVRLDAPSIVHPVFSEPFFTASLYQTAGTTKYYSWAKGIDYSVRTGTSYDGETAPLPDCPLTSGMSYQFGLENGQAGDITTTVILLYESDV